MVWSFMKTGEHEGDEIISAAAALEFVHTALVALRQWHCADF